LKKNTKQKTTNPMGQHANKIPVTMQIDPDILFETFRPQLEELIQQSVNKRLADIQQAATLPALLTPAQAAQFVGVKDKRTVARRFPGAQVWKDGKLMYKRRLLEG
jgi:hypothetical protein